MRSSIKLAVVLIAIFGLFSLFIGCEGKQGPPGPAGTDGKNASSCMAPCHNVNGIWGQYLNSTHYIAILNAEEQESWTTGNCGKCHAKDALASRLDGTAGGGKPTNLLEGQISYLSSTGSVSEATYDGTEGENANFAQVACRTCHKSTKETPDRPPHDSLYVTGTWLLRAPTTGVYIEKSSAASKADGMKLDYGTGNTCVWCHKSRKDVTDYIKSATVTLGTSSRYWGPHEGPGADLYSGKGGYEFSGKDYTTNPSAHVSELKKACVDCHMAPVKENNNYPRHDFKPEVSDQCLKCHTGAKTIADIGTANKDNLVKLLTQIQKLFNEYTPGGTGAKAGLLSRTDNASAVNDSVANTSDPVLTSTQLGKDFYLDRGRVQRINYKFDPNTGKYSSTRVSITLPQDVAGALYNYYVVSRAKGYGPHNYKYAARLLFDSIEKLGATPVISPRP